MIAAKTVFIVGAGASVPYGFPTGEELLEILTTALLPPKSRCRYQDCYSSQFRERRHDIDGRVNPPNHFDYTPLLAIGIDESDIFHFHQNLYYSGSKSVDSFLQQEVNRKYLKIGKAAIAAALIPYEREKALFTISRDNLIRKIFGKLTSGELPKTGSVAFVTFNYDCTLEYFFQKGLMALKGFDNHVAQATQKVRLPVHHVYGQLGTIDSQEATFREYSPSANAKDVLRSSKMISLIRENEADETVSNQIDLVSNADLVVFLGFGFDKDNLSRIGIHWDKNNFKYYDHNFGQFKYAHPSGPIGIGTGYGLSDAQRSFISEKLPGLKICEESSTGCAEYFDNNPALLGLFEGDNEELLLKTLTERSFAAKN